MIKVGLIGLGYWGPNLARVLQQASHCQLVACCDVDPKSLAKIANQYPQVRGYSSCSELLRSDVHAVVIATPIATHYELALEALQCGKHVLVEKPLADTSTRADALNSAANDRGRILMTGHTFVYSPPVVKVKELIDSGAMGKLDYISFSRVNLGLYRKDVDVTWDLAVHDISILLYWVGELPIAAASFGRACVQENKDDVAFMWFRFRNGLVCACEVSWLSPQKMRRTSVVGSKRMIVYDDLELSEKVKVFDRGVIVHEPRTFGEFQLTYRMGDVISPTLANTEPLLAEVEHFLSCIETGQQPRTNGKFGADVVRGTEMAMSSRALLRELVESTGR